LKTRRYSQGSGAWLVFAMLAGSIQISFTAHATGRLLLGDARYDAPRSLTAQVAAT